MDFVFENIDFSKVSDDQLYEYGNIFMKDRDIDNAIKFYFLAAEKGHLGAQFTLAGKYFYGSGVQKNIEEALKWYKIAAQSDDAEEILFDIMGEEELYDFGCKFLDYGDIDIGIKCLTLSAEQEYAEAQCCLGDIYRCGNLVEEDLDKAIKWYKLAAENGERFAQQELGKMYYDGIGVEQNQEEALKWLTASEK